MIVLEQWDQFDGMTFRIVARPRSTYCAHVEVQLQGWTGARNPKDPAGSIGKEGWKTANADGGMPPAFFVAGEEANVFVCTDCPAWVEWFIGSAGTRVRRAQRRLRRIADRAERRRLRADRLFDELCERSIGEE